MTEPAIQVNNLTCRFGKTVAVDQLSLEVPTGKIYGFLGENGAGKTTTIRTLMGLLRPTSGSVRVLGQDPLGGNAPLLQRIGYVSDDRAMYRWMKVKEVLRFNAGLYEHWDKAHAKELLGEFELEPSKRVRHLSRGQLAKLALLCALAPQPDVLILDEASSGLDAIVRRTILEKLIDVASSRKTTIFISSHLVEEIDRVAELVAILCRGRLIVEGNKDSVRASLKRVIFPASASAPDRGPDMHGVFSARQVGKEWQLVVRDLDEKKLTELKNKMGTVPHTIEMSLEDVFAEYTAWAKKNDKDAAATKAA